MNSDRSIRKFIVIAFMSAIISVLSPFVIILPVSPVPISLATFAIYLTVYILGAKYGFVSTLIYILLGMVGVPVFTGFTGGAGKILGPTGGYIIGYLFLAIIAGLIIERDYNNTFLSFIGMAVGTIVLYIFGSVWLMITAHMTFWQAIVAGVVPFIIGDLIKMFIACIVGKKIRTTLIKARFL